MDNQANLFPYPQENPIADNQTIDPPLQAELQTAQAALKVLFYMHDYMAAEHSKIVYALRIDYKPDL